jgi:hypothetical protein
MLVVVVVIQFGLLLDMLGLFVVAFCVGPIGVASKSCGLIDDAVAIIDSFKSSAVGLVSISIVVFVSFPITAPAALSNDEVPVVLLVRTAPACVAPTAALKLDAFLLFFFV